MIVNQKGREAGGHEVRPGNGGHCGSPDRYPRPPADGRQEAAFRSMSFLVPTCPYRPECPTSVALDIHDDLRHQRG